MLAQQSIEMTVVVALDGDIVIECWFDLRVLFG